MRVLDEPQEVPKRILDGSDLDTAAHLRRFLVHLDVQLAQALELRRNIGNAPVGERPVRTRHAIRNEAELESAPFGPRARVEEDLLATVAIDVRVRRPIGREAAPPNRLRNRESGESSWG